MHFWLDGSGGDNEDGNVDIENDKNEYHDTENDENAHLALSPSKDGRHFWSDGQKTFSHGSLMHGPENIKIRKHANDKT